MADRHDLLDHLRGRVGGAGARAPEVADEGGCADPLKHCRTLIETESEASKDTKEAQAHLDQNVPARCAAGSPSHDSGPVLSKNTNELKTGAPGPFRSSSPRGKPQIWGVSEAMSAIRVPRTRRENTVEQRDATLPGGDLDPGPGRTWTRTC